MAVNVLVAVPCRPNEHPFFLDCIDKYRLAFDAHNPGFTFDFGISDVDFRGGRSRLGAIAAARNAIIAEHLTDEHDFVLTLDSDVVSLPFDLVSRLHAANPLGVTAPLVLIEGTDLFYDTAAFLENGRRCNRERPYFAGEDELVSLDSVGTVYLAPASLFRDGVRYADEPAGLTDHEEVCAAAWAHRMRVACLTTVAAHHADLPLYGIPWR